MIEDHAEFKDACQELETRIDEISDDLRKLPTDYKMIGQYFPSVNSLVFQTGYTKLHSTFCGQKLWQTPPRSKQITSLLFWCYCLRQIN